MKWVTFFILLVLAVKLNAQKIESIHFNPLTDSVKKGFNYYINIDAKLINGKWLPLTDSELLIKTNFGIIKGNNVIVPLNFEPKEINVAVALKADTTKKLEIILPIKQLPDPELKAMENKFNNIKATKSSKKKRKA